MIESACCCDRLMKLLSVVAALSSAAVMTTVDVESVVSVTAGCCVVLPTHEAMAKAMMI